MYDVVLLTLGSFVGAVSGAWLMLTGSHHVLIRRLHRERQRRHEAKFAATVALDDWRAAVDRLTALRGHEEFARLMFRDLLQLTLTVSTCPECRATSADGVFLPTKLGHHRDSCAKAAAMRGIQKSTWKMLAPALSEPSALEGEASSRQSAPTPSHPTPRAAARAPISRECAERVS